jgi:hypothetical protein
MGIEICGKEKGYRASVEGYLPRGRFLQTHFEAIMAPPGTGKLFTPGAGLLFRMIPLLAQDTPLHHQNEGTTCELEIHDGA